MAASAGPDIVEDGLVLYLDAGNEESYLPRKNMLSNTHEPLNSNGWSYSNSTVSLASGIESPVGNGSVVNVTNTSGYGDVNRLASFNFISGSVYTISGYFKKNTSPVAYIQGSSSPFPTGRIELNLDTLTIDDSGATSEYIGSTVIESNNGWVRFTVTSFATQGVTSQLGRIRFGSSGSGDGIYVTAPQVELGSVATDYQEIEGDVFPTTYKDLSGNGNDGTLTNGPTFGGDNMGGIIFDGLDDRVVIPSTTYTFSGGTLDMWINIKELNILQGFFGLNGQGSYVNFFMFDTNKMRWELIGDNTLPYSSITSNKIFDKDIWYNVVGTFNGTQTFFYVNGIQDSSISTENQPTTYTATAYIGSYATYYHGNSIISNVRLYNRALSAEEILQNYNATKSRFYDI